MRSPEEAGAAGVTVSQAGVRRSGQRWPWWGPHGAERGVVSTGPSKGCGQHLHKWVLGLQALRPPPLDPGHSEAGEAHSPKYPANSAQEGRGSEGEGSRTRDKSQHHLVVGRDLTALCLSFLLR